MTFDEIKNNRDVRVYITKADEALAALGYTEHSFAHVTKVAEDAAYILESLGYDGHTVELAKISGYLHDIGNLVNRVDHSQSGAVMAFRILDNLGMSADDISTVVSAIGNHDEGTGVPVNCVAAALIIADKSDVRRTRVRNSDQATFDIHDRVNYSVERSALSISSDKKRAVLDLTIDSEISAVMDYFQIFIGRMQMSKLAASFLGLDFSLVINGQKLL
jgi:metal-dependent HD superfamily phosphatase/phosphodiesterase